MGHRGGLGPRVPPGLDGRERLPRPGPLPNAVGIGGQVLANDVEDPVLRQLCVEIYNDAMAELQDWSGNRFIPMPVMPAWDIAACVREAQRIAALGFRGVNMTSDPQETGSPDFADPAWDPFWDACQTCSSPSTSTSAPASRR